MNIPANVVLVDYSFDQPFHDIDKAVLFRKEHMRLDGDAWHEMLGEFLSGKLVRWGGAASGYGSRNRAPCCGGNRRPEANEGTRSRR